MRRRAAIAFVALAMGAAGALRAQEEPAAPRPAAPPAAGAAAQHPPAAARPGKPARPALPDTARPVEYQREVFRYGGGPRDPFESLVTTNDVGPMVSDLRLVSIVYDARYGNSVAIIRAARNPAPIRLHRGDTIGRMRVIQIRQYEVVLQIEEFGFERQEVLALRRPEVSR